MIDGQLVIASVSGGKDSTALSLWLKEQGIEHRRVFADTGWEHQYTIDYINDYLPKHIGDIETVKPDLGMSDLILKKGMFPGRLNRFCTTELKMKPIREYLRQFDDEDLINAIGIRGGESRARAKLTEWDHSTFFECDVWRPLIDWTVDDVIAIHKRHGVEPNRLYLKGAERVGCWPCIFARKKEVKLIAKLSPERIDEIESLESTVAEMARGRYAAKGETLESLGYSEPTFFGEGADHPKIIDVVDWAKTTHGGKQYSLLDTPSERDFCMRWGFCDTGED